MKKLFAIIMSVLMIACFMPTMAFAADGGNSQTPTITWEDGKTVEYGGTQYETLVEALTAVYKSTPTDTAVINCKPDADVGIMTHSHVADSIIINGNGAYVSGGEHDLEIDTYQFDRSTGKQKASTGATNDDYLSKDITVTVNNLNGIAAWGQRHTNHTINLVFNNCKNMNRVYISGITGTNNITLNNCSFDGEAVLADGNAKNTSVYSNAPGEINVINCEFKNVAIPINLNNKSTGIQEVTISNSKFTDCSTEEVVKTTNSSQYAAPIRIVAKQNATTKLDINGAQITYSDGETNAGNGDILLGDGRSDAEEQQGKVIIDTESTAANVVVQKKGYYNTDGTVAEASKMQTKQVTADETLKAESNSIFSNEEVAEINGVKYASLQDAVSTLPNVANGEALPVVTKIKLLKDTNGGFDFGLEKERRAVNAVLDLNGKTLTLGPAIGSKGTETNGIRTLAYSKLEIKNGTLKCSNLGVDVTTSDGTKTRYTKVGIANYSITTLDNVKVEAGDRTIYTINNGGELNLKGTTTVETGKNAFADDNPTLRRSAINNQPYHAYYTAMNASVNVDSEDVNVGKMVIFTTGSESKANTEGKSEINISAGKYGNIEAVGGGDKVIWNITGGTFSEDPSQYLSNLVKAEQNDDGTYSVVPNANAVAQIGGTYYASLQDALAAAADNATIRLLSNVKLSSKLTINKPITLDGSSKTITANGISGDHLILLTANATVKNVKLDSNKVAKGVNTYGQAKDLTFNFENVEMLNSAGTGITAKGGTVTLKDVKISGSAWKQSVDISPSDKQGDTQLQNGADLIVVGNTTLGDTLQVVFDRPGEGRAVGTITADGWNVTSEDKTFGEGDKAYTKTVITLAKKSTSGGGAGGGGFVVIPTETPLDKAKTEANTAISAAASTNKYDEAEQAEVKAILDKAAADIKNAKTEEEVKAIQEAAQAEIDKVLTTEEKAQIKAVKGVDKEIFKAKSKYSKLKGKRAIKVTWNVPNGMKFDGFEIYRSTKKYSGYGKTPYFTTTKTSYINSKGLVKGKTYYYKVRAFVIINGEKVYTDYSTKAFRKIK